MTTTAHWLHLKLGLPLVDNDDADARSDEATVTPADLVARQKAFAARPLAVEFVAR